MSEIKEIKDSVVKIIDQIFKEEGRTADSVETDFLINNEINSITFLSIIVAIETHFNLTIPNELLDMENFKQIDDICKIIINELNRKC